MIRKNISSGAPWEDIVGYSRAVIVGDQIHISGTTATNEAGNIVGENDPYQQTKVILNKIHKLLETIGSSIENVYRTRMYVTNIDNWKQYGRAHQDVFQTIKPATSMIEVSRLISPKMLIEIEVEAYLN